jgi:hypothetical protein
MTTHKLGPTATGASAKVGRISLDSKPDRSVGTRIATESQA